MLLTAIHELTLDIGEIPISVRTDNADFAGMLRDRYGEFVVESELGTRDPGLEKNRTSDLGLRTPVCELEVRLVEPRLEKDEEAGLESLESGVGGEEEAGLGTRETEDVSRNPYPVTRIPFPDSAVGPDPDVDVSVRVEAGRWIIERGDFRAEWDPESKRGWVRQTPNPYAIDGVLRILHSLILARSGGFLVHGASGVRNGRAFVFAGVSGTGKTTLARLAPPDVTLLTDEISYVRDSGLGTRDSGKTETRDKGYGVRDTGNKETGDTESGIRGTGADSRVPSRESRIPVFTAFGTPFAGELARIGEKVQAPLAALFLLKQGPENRIEPVSNAQAVRELMRHVLFFAHDQELVGMIFQTVCDFVKSVPVRRLVFTPDARVWEMIG